MSMFSGVNLRMCVDKFFFFDVVIVFFFSDVLIVLFLGKKERYYWFGFRRSASSSSGDSMFLWRITVLSVHRGFRPFPDPQNMVGHSFRLHAFIGGMRVQGRVMCVTHSNVVCEYQKDVNNDCVNTFDLHLMCIL